MPLIEVHLDRTTFTDHSQAIGEAIHAAQIQTLKIPADDRFQVFTPHNDGEVVYDPGYGGVDRQSLIIIRVTAVAMYDAVTKKAFFEAVVSHLERIGIRPEDVLISLVENDFDDWYAGKI